MTESSSFLMESIRTSSIRDRNRPIISFFGRPGDPRKGVLTFFDALTVLAHLSFVPDFSVWIVGGSDAEADVVESLILARPAISEMKGRGSLAIWGRVSTEALPELYSRSSLVVMPSSREQFGIVAIEAMMCETPVIASNVGGLADIVLNGHTGVLVPPDRPSSLANVILGYLRNRDRVQREGVNARRWAVRGFSQDQTYRLYGSVYGGGPPPPPFPQRSVLRADELSQLRSRACAVLDEDVRAEDISSSDHTSATLATATGSRYFAKWYRPERADHISVLPVTEELRRERTIADYAGRLVFHKDNPRVPRVMRLPTESEPLAIFEWCSPGQFDDPLKQLHDVAAAFRSYRRIEDDDAAGQIYLNALRNVAVRRDLESIAAHDIAAATLNRRLVNAGLRFQQVHPQIELLRMQLLLRGDAWAIAADARERFIATIAFVLDQSAMAIETPAVCHGSLKLEHLLVGSEGSIVACDTDSSRYIVGPFDEVHHVWNAVTTSQSFGASRALSRLTAMLEPRENVGLAASWLLVYLIFDALLTVTSGGDASTTRAVQFCRDLPYVWNRFITPLR